MFLESYLCNWVQYDSEHPIRAFRTAPRELLQPSDNAAMHTNMTNLFNSYKYYMSKDSALYAPLTAG
jgi:hypothetical protein